LLGGLSVSSLWGQGGHLIAAHVTRCLLHARSTHNPADRDSAEIDLPQNRDRTLETPLTPADIDDTIGQFLPKIHDQNAHVDFSPHDTTVDLAVLYLGSHVENDTQDADQTSDNAQKTASSLNPDMESTELNRNAHYEAKPMHSHLPPLSGSVRAQAGVEPPADEPPIEIAADELRESAGSKEGVGSAKVLAEAEAPSRRSFSPEQPKLARSRETIAATEIRLPTLPTEMAPVDPA
jgi:hypothetical protein